MVHRIDHDTTVPEVAPLAIGVLGFEPDDTGDMVVPAVSVRRLPDDRVVVTTIDDAEWRDALAAPTTSAITAGAFNVIPEPVDRYLAAVATARDAVRGARRVPRHGRLPKILDTAACLKF